MDEEDLSSNYYAGKIYFPVTQETMRKLVKNGIIDEQVYYKIRSCEEFLPRIEYSQQFRTVFDKVMKGLAAGKALKDIIK